MNLKTDLYQDHGFKTFTASWLGAGNYLKYGKAEIEAQIKALKDNGIDEYLLWNAGNSYTTGCKL